MLRRDIAQRLWRITSSKPPVLGNPPSIPLKRDGGGQVACYGGWKDGSPHGTMPLPVGPH